MIRYREMTSRCSGEEKEGEGDTYFLTLMCVVFFISFLGITNLIENEGGDSRAYP